MLFSDLLIHDSPQRFLKNKKKNVTVVARQTTGDEGQKSSERGHLNDLVVITGFFFLSLPLKMSIVNETIKTLRLVKPLITTFPWIGERGWYKHKNKGNGKIINSLMTGEIFSE